MSARPQMPCAEFVECVTDYLEDALFAQDKERLEEHLAGCEHCAQYLEQLRTTLRLTRELRAADVPPEVRDHLFDAFARWRTR